jgi:hypothetical protein
MPEPLFIWAKEMGSAVRVFGERVMRKPKTNVREVLVQK